MRRDEDRTNRRGERPVFVYTANERDMLRSGPRLRRQQLRPQ